MHALGARIEPDLRAYTICQIRIPSSRERNSRGHGGGGTEVAHTQRTVRHLEPRQVEARQIANKKIVNAAEHIDLFLERHLAEHRLDPLLDGTKAGRSRLPLRL